MRISILYSYFHTSTVSCIAFFMLSSSFLLFNSIGHALYKRYHCPCCHCICLHAHKMQICYFTCMYKLVQKLWRILLLEGSIASQSQASALQPIIVRKINYGEIWMIHGWYTIYSCFFFLSCPEPFKLDTILRAIQAWLIDMDNCETLCQLQEDYYHRCMLWWSQSVSAGILYICWFFQTFFH